MQHCHREVYIRTHRRQKRGIMPKIETTSMRARKQYFSHRLFKLKATRAHESFHISIL